jgi:CRP-like cAMP-binding protein
MADRSHEDVEWLVANGAEQQVPAGRELLTESEASSTVYIVLEGSFGIGEGAGAAALGPGEVAGPPSITRRAPGKVVARTDAVVWAVPRERLQARIDQDAGVTDRFRRVAAGLTLEWVRAIRARNAAGGASRRAAPRDGLDSLRVYELIERMLRGDLPGEDEEEEEERD